MAIKILTFRNFVLRDPDPESQWINLDTGQLDNDLDTHLASGWTLIGLSTTVFNNEERLHFVLTI